MQSTAPEEYTPSRLARLCMRLSGLPLGGFAAPPAAMMGARATEDASTSAPAPVRLRPRTARSRIRWISLSAVR